MKIPNDPWTQQWVRRGASPCCLSWTKPPASCLPCSGSPTASKTRIRCPSLGWIRERKRVIKKRNTFPAIKILGKRKKRTFPAMVNPGYSPPAFQLPQCSPGWKNHFYILSLIIKCNIRNVSQVGTLVIALLFQSWLWTWVPSWRGAGLTQGWVATPKERSALAPCYACKTPGYAFIIQISYSLLQLALPFTQ